jgi:hypothetical protein
VTKKADEAIASIKSGALDDSLATMRQEIDKRVSDPGYKGRKPVPQNQRGPTVHCRGLGTHSPHYYQNMNSRYYELLWCTGTL